MGKIDAPFCCSHKDIFRISGNCIQKMSKFCCLVSVTDTVPYWRENTCICLHSQNACMPRFEWLKSRLSELKLVIMQWFVSCLFMALFNPLLFEVDILSCMLQFWSRIFSLSPYYAMGYLGTCIGINDKWQTVGNMIRHDQIKQSLSCHSGNKKVLWTAALSSYAALCVPYPYLLFSCVFHSHLYSLVPIRV